MLTSQMPFAVDLINSNRDQFRYEWIWEKTYPTGFLNANRMPLKVHENILVYYDSLGIYNPQGIKFGKKTPTGTDSGNYGDYKTGFSERDDKKGIINYPRDVIIFGKDESELHPTAKPVPLFEYLIKTYTDEGDLVMDNCMGSGTTAVACIRSGRHYIGYETDKGYYDIAMRRISESKRVWDKQTRLI